MYDAFRSVFGTKVKKSIRIIIAATSDFCAHSGAFQMSPVTDESKWFKWLICLVMERPNDYLCS